MSTTVMIILKHNSSHKGASQIVMTPYEDAEPNKAPHATKGDTAVPTIADYQVGTSRPLAVSRFHSPTIITPVCACINIYTPHMQQTE